MSTLEEYIEEKIRFWEEMTIFLRQRAASYDEFIKQLKADLEEIRLE